jgi:phosphoenolpyruvate carboxykinase (ATP)
MENPFPKAAAEIRRRCRLIPDPGREALRGMARSGERTTEYGSASYVTRIRSRSARFTEIVFEPGPSHDELLSRVVEHLDGREMIEVERTMCLKAGHRTRIRLLVSGDCARLAYMWRSMLFEPEGGGGPDFTIIDVPEWPERKVLVDPVSFTTFILGSDYCGEVKKAGLRMMMYFHKTRRGGLGLHAGSKILRVMGNDGKLSEKGMLLFGLSATGKTTLTCHHHWLDAAKGELVRIRQDDVVMLERDCSVVGTEENFYIKTDGLEPGSQPLLYKGAISPRAILENVFVGDGGKVDFFDSSLTSNGRAVVVRKELDFADDSIDLDGLDIMVFITRRKTIVPPLARLSPAQAAAFFMLGESVETSAGDPAQAGKPLRVVGTNPFIIGPFDEEGNRFMEILEANRGVGCYLMNTGSFGAGPGKEGIKITVYDSARMLAEVARGAVRWKSDPDWGYDVASRCGDLDMGRFEPSAHYPAGEYSALTEALRNERREWLAQFPGLRKEIREAIEKH